MNKNPFDHAALRAQADRQRKYAWDLMDDIPWKLGIDTSKYFLPLDDDAIAFPGASSEQRLALSQLLGLLVNCATAQIETIIKEYQSTAWESILREFPANPEMWELGELFFDEEEKHAAAFFKFVEIFCDETGIEPRDLTNILPNSYESVFVKALTLNCRAGGHAFWWLVAGIEETSIALYKEIHRHKSTVDPLYYQIHLKHMEEESRHYNYAFLMLDIINRRDPSIRHYVHRKTSLLQAQILQSGWVLGQLNKFFEVKRLENRHPFFKVLASCLPLLKNMGMVEIARRLFTSTPHLSLLLNSRNHKLTVASARNLQAISLPFPEPKRVETSAPMGETLW